MNIEQIQTRIAEIDNWFEEAKSWGSWMSEASSERRELVAKAALLGVQIEHKHVLRTASGKIAD